MSMLPECRVVEIQILFLRQERGAWRLILGAVNIGSNLSDFNFLLHLSSPAIVLLHNPPCTVYFSVSVDMLSAPTHPAFAFPHDWTC